MKKFYLLILLILIGGWGIKKANAQYLVVKLQDGTTETTELNTLQSLKFPDNLLQLNFTSGSVQSYDLSTVSTLYFQQYQTSVDDFLTDDSQSISVYPNPASNKIFIKNASENASLIAVYRIDGTLVLQKQYSGQNESIDISSLTSGIYVLRIENQAIKFIKQ